MHRHQLPEEPLTLFSEGTNIVWSIGESHVIKIFPPFHQTQYQNESLVLQHLQNKLSVETPTLQFQGELTGWPYLVMNKLEGTLLEMLWETMPSPNKTIIIQELGALIREVHDLPTQGLEAIDCQWEQFIERQMHHCIEHHRSKKLPEKILDQLPAYMESVKSNLPQITRPVILTGEYTPMNFLVHQIDEVWYIKGLIDFGDAMLGAPQYDLLGPGAFLIQGNKELLKEFLLAYGYSTEELTENLSQQFMGLMLLHQYSNLNIQIRIKDWENQVHSLQELENLVWGF